MTNEPNKKKVATLLFIGLMILFLSRTHLVAQTDAGRFTTREISLTIDSLNRKLTLNYVFPEVAAKMTEVLRDNLTKGKYNVLTDPNDLARQLTTDLHAVSKDKHLMVVYNPVIIARENALTDTDRANEEAEWAKELATQLKRDNYGFKEVKILDGNIGYLDLREFVDPMYGGEALTAVMHILRDADAIIIDLRQNDGGSPQMVQLLASYFFSSEPVHLANHYNRPKNERTESWTLRTVPGIRRPEVELYILTSEKTFSAAEAFSYELKHLKRATLVGERTAGGAHLTGSVIATDKIYVRIPQGRTTSPITMSDWEGTGVIPDIEVPAEQALQVAHSRAQERKHKR